MKNLENASSPVVRTQLLTAQLDSPKTVECIEIRRVDMLPNIASGPHLHPCPVVGMILEGSVLFQIEGELVLGGGNNSTVTVRRRVL
jgi:hypothetical protein